MMASRRAKNKIRAQKISKIEAEEKAKDIKNGPINIVPWIPVLCILGFALGFFICWLTFSKFGGN